MEAVIVLAAALIVIVALETGYGIARCLVRWTPSLLLGVIAVWIAHRHGASLLQATAAFVVTALVTQRLLIPSLFRDRSRSR